MDARDACIASMKQEIYRLRVMLHMQRAGKDTARLNVAQISIIHAHFKAGYPAEMSAQLLGECHG